MITILAPLEFLRRILYVELYPFSVCFLRAFQIIKRVEFILYSWFLPQIKRFTKSWWELNVKDEWGFALSCLEHQFAITWEPSFEVGVIFFFFKFCMFWLIRERRSASLCSTTSSFACMVFFYACSGQSEIDVFLVFATPDFLFRYHGVELLGSVIYISFQWCVANSGFFWLTLEKRVKRDVRFYYFFSFIS